MPQYLNFETARFEGVGKYNIPELDPVYEVDVENWIGFNYCKTSKLPKATTGVQFFIDDYQFERTWNQPTVYVKMLKGYGCVLSPDWSMFTDFPLAMQIFNHYRKHWMARYWQDNGLTVVPTICWSDERSYDFCFDGEPLESVVAVSNVGCMQDKESARLFEQGYNEMLERLRPKEVLFFAKTFGDYDGPITYIRYHIAKGMGVY